MVYNIYIYVNFKNNIYLSKALLQRAAEEQQAAEEENRQRVAQARETHYQQVARKVD